MTHDLLNFSLQWIHQHNEYSWLLTFIISTAESIAIIGTILPGTVTMTAIGALAGAGVIPLWETIFWAFLGAVVGDGISYAIGHYFKERLVNIWPLNLNPALLTKGESFFRNYGGLSVLIGRFIGPIRALIPMIAGMMGMKPWNFIIANVVSGAGWALAYILPGALLGAAALELPPHIATKILLIIILCPLAIWGTVWLMKCLFPALNDRIISAYDTAKSTNKIWVILLNYIIASSNQEKIKQQVNLLCYFFLALIGLIIFATYIRFHISENILINQATFHLFNSFVTPAGQNLAIYFTLLGQDMVVVSAALAIIVWLYFNNSTKLALHGLVLLGLTCGSIRMFKNLTLSPRPSTLFNVMGSYSFPSGHTTMATMFYGSILFLLYNKISSPNIRKIAITGVAAIILSVMCSRLYLGVHWLTDLLGGLLLGATGIIGTTISLNRCNKEYFNVKKFILFSCLIFTISYTSCYYLSSAKLRKYIYTSHLTNIKFITLQQWAQQESSLLNDWNVTVMGFKSQLINLEWLGTLAEIKTKLLNSGWQEASHHRTWNDILFRLSGIKSTQYLPLLDPLYLRLNAELVLVKKLSTSKTLLVLRLWPTNIQLHNTSQRLWVGVVSKVPRTYSWLLDYHTTEINLNKNIIFNNNDPGTEISYVKILTAAQSKKLPTNTIMLIR